MQYVGVHAFLTQSVFIPSAQPFLTCRPWQIGQVIVAVPALGCPKVSQGELTRHGQTSLPCLTQFGFFVNNWEHINTVLRRLWMCIQIYSRLFKLFYCYSCTNCRSPCFRSFDEDLWDSSQMPHLLSSGQICIMLRFVNICCHSDTPLVIDF